MYARSTVCQYCLTFYKTLIHSYIYPLKALQILYTCKRNYNIIQYLLDGNVYLVLMLLRVYTFTFNHYIGTYGIV